MPYRDDREALLARAADLERELHEVEIKAAELVALKSVEHDLRHQLADVRTMLDGPSAALDTSADVSALNDIRVASPCTADWDKMIGDERKRFCEACGQSVYNVESLRRDEVANLLARGDSVCMRLFRRPDGTLMTADCPVGKRRIRLKQIATVVGGSLLAGVAAAVVAHEVRESKLHEIYTVEVSAEGHHHRLATQTPAITHMNGRDAAPALPPPLAPARATTTGGRSPIGHTMGVMAPPGKHKASCDLPRAKFKD
jgi:hypothetical protein